LDLFSTPNQLEVGVGVDLRAGIFESVRLFVIELVLQFWLMRQWANIEWGLQLLTRSRLYSDTCRSYCYGIVVVVVVTLLAKQIKF